jgi:hypothetical protein
MKNGKYILVVAPNDYIGKRYRDRYAYEHIVEFWKKEGRLPLPDHVIHHKNHITTDNSWDNLEEIHKATHSRNHGLEKPIKHGTLVGYRRKCRCDLCKEAQKLHTRKYRAKAATCCIKTTPY